jgi:alpha-L-arabinofuranosidase
MNIIQGEGYVLKMAARATDGFAGPLTAKLLSATGQELASGEIADLGNTWKYHTLDLNAADSDAQAHLVVSGTGHGSVYLDMVSLLPQKTWKGHGLRTDLAESVNGLQPSFVRFPGGCWVEGDDMAHMNHWKRTIGDFDVREPLWNIWGYFATHSLGFHEYLQMTEDLGATPLFCINVGMSHHESIPMDRMGEWAQDALDAIEYANGPTNSVWGAVRARAGHPGPFNLRYMEIGNENGGPDYYPRWALLVNAIRAKYPEMHLISDTDLRGRPLPTDPAPDIVDEHYYESPESFMNRADQYDKYDRNGPKIFVGEYAVTQNAGKGNLRAAIGEAAFMTGLERNSDVVIMASYAPLLVNLNHRAWNPDMINFDSSRWYGIPSYYVQQMFSANRGDVTLPVTVQAEIPADQPVPGGIGVGTWNTSAEFKDIKVTAPDGTVLFTSDFSQNADGWKELGGGEWKVADGALQQSAQKEFVRALAGDRSWTDYTYEVKARKLAGAEGFLILFHINDDEDRVWWNLGGWGNTRDAVEWGGTLDGVPGEIETGRWYDLKVVVKGQSVTCFLDGKQVHHIERPPVKPLYASATREQKSGDVIVKVVNAAAGEMETEIDLDGIKNPAGAARATVLTSTKGSDENTLENPAKVSPREETMDLSGSTLVHKFPGNSLTVLRIGAGN